MEGFESKSQKGQCNRDRVKTGGGPPEDNDDLDEITLMIIDMIPRVFDSIGDVKDDDYKDDSVKKEVSETSTETCFEFLIQSPYPTPEETNELPPPHPTSLARIQHNKPKSSSSATWTTTTAADAQKEIQSCLTPVITIPSQQISGSQRKRTFDLRGQIEEK